MHCNNNICDEMARWRYNRNTSLAELEMNAIVQQCGGCVADKWR